VTALLIEWRGGDAGAVQKLLPLVHDELRRLAKRHMAGAGSCALLRDGRSPDAPRARGFRRARNNQKRGGLLNRVTFDENLPVASDAPEDLIAIDNALRSLRRSTNERTRSSSCVSSAGRVSRKPRKC